MLFCVGDFFGNDSKEFEELLSGEINGIFEYFYIVLVVLPTFIVCPLTETAKKFVGSGEGCDLHDKVIFLGLICLFFTFRF